MKSKVYFSRTITPEKVLELYKLADKTLPGKVALKVHSGETGNQNFLRPDFWKPVKPGIFRRPFATPASTAAKKHFCWCVRRVWKSMTPLLLPAVPYVW